MLLCAQYCTRYQTCIVWALLTVRHGTLYQAHLVYKLQIYVQDFQLSQNYQDTIPASKLHDIWAIDLAWGQHGHLAM